MTLNDLRNTVSAHSLVLPAMDIISCKACDSFLPMFLDVGICEERNVLTLTGRTCSKNTYDEKIHVYIHES